MFVEQQHRHGDRHVYAPRTRFIPDAILDNFDRFVPADRAGSEAQPLATGGPRVDIAARLRATWA